MGIQRSDLVCCNETLTVKMFIFPTLKTVESNRTFHFLNAIFIYLNMALDFFLLLWLTDFWEPEQHVFTSSSLKTNSYTKKEYYLLESGCTVSLLTLLFIPRHYEYAWKTFPHPDLLAFLSRPMAALVRTGAVLVPSVAILWTNAVSSFMWSSNVHLAVLLNLVEI